MSKRDNQLLIQDMLEAANKIVDYTDVHFMVGTPSSVKVFLLSCLVLLQVDQAVLAITSFCNHPQ